MKKKETFFNVTYGTIFILLLALFGFLCIYKLGDQAIADWDEARHGVSAYEMLKNREWIVTTYQNDTDYWNLKPPMSEWVMALGYRFFGFTPFGMRIYSAVSMILTALLCALFTLKATGKLSALVVLLGFSTSRTLLFDHCARTGDADALFLLFSTAAILALCEYYRTASLSKRSDIYLYLSCLCFSLAFLTKSWHAGCIGLLIFASLIFSKRLFHFTLKNWFFCALCASGPILLWVAARVAKDGTTFLMLMFQHDMLERTSTALEGHTGGKGYYINFLWNQKGFIILSLMAAFALPQAEMREKKDIIHVLVLSIALPLLLFTIASTKLYWYIYCIFPSVIILAAFGINEIIYNAKKLSAGLITVALPICMLLICIRGNLDSVRGNFNQNSSTALLAMLDRTEVFAEQNVFKTGNWEQSEVLAAELGGDMHPQWGDAAAWYQDETAYLFTTVDMLPTIEVEYQIVSEYDPYCIIRHD